MAAARPPERSPGVFLDWDGQPLGTVMPANPWTGMVHNIVAPLRHRLNALCVSSVRVLATFINPQTNAATALTGTASLLAKRDLGDGKVELIMGTNEHVVPDKNRDKVLQVIQYTTQVATNSRQAPPLPTCTKMSNLADIKKWSGSPRAKDYDLAFLRCVVVAAYANQLSVVLPVAPIRGGLREAGLLAVDTTPAAERSLAKDPVTQPSQEGPIITTELTQPAPVEDMPPPVAPEGWSLGPAPPGEAPSAAPAEIPPADSPVVDKRAGVLPLGPANSFPPAAVEVDRLGEDDAVRRSPPPRRRAAGSRSDGIVGTMDASTRWEAMTHELVGVGYPGPTNTRDLFDKIFVPTQKTAVMGPQLAVFKHSVHHFAPTKRGISGAHMAHVQNPLGTYCCIHRGRTDTAEDSRVAKVAPAEGVANECLHTASPGYACAYVRYVLPSADSQNAAQLARYLRSVGPVLNENCADLVTIAKEFLAENKDRIGKHRDE